MRLREWLRVVWPRRRREYNCWWIGGPLGQWRNRDNWKDRRIPKSGDLVHFQSEVTITDGMGLGLTLEKLEEQDVVVTKGVTMSTTDKIGGDVKITGLGAADRSRRSKMSDYGIGPPEWFGKIPHWTGIAHECPPEQHRWVVSKLDGYYECEKCGRTKIMREKPPIPQEESQP